MRTLTCLLAFTATACIEDTTLGWEASGLELPRGVTRPLDLTTVAAPLPPASAFLLDVDDPSLAAVSLSADKKHVVVRAMGEGQTIVHLTYRETTIHIPTTILPAATVALTVRPGGVTAPIGSTVALAALALDTADETIDVTARTLWTVDNPQVARLFSDGTLQAMSAGVTSLRAEVDGVVQTASVSIVER